MTRKARLTVPGTVHHIMLRGIEKQDIFSDFVKKAIESDRKNRLHLCEYITRSKSFEISRHTVMEAWRRVKANGGIAGVDGQTIENFEERLKDNLYRIWNRMSSGSYFPPPVLLCEIPKEGGKVRTLGIPTVADRVAQTVVKMHLEPKVEPVFHNDSYGYRPGKSTLEAIGVTRERC